jgi:hypothetical protein
MAKPAPNEQLLSHANELIKTYIEFDIQGRQSKVYTAVTDAPHGADCVVTEYIYSTPAGTTIQAMKEANDSWDSAWDADFTVGD